MEVSFVSLLSCNQLGWWHEQWGGPPPTHPIGHQELRDEVTWTMRRRTLPLPPLFIRSWELKWHEQWGGVPAYWDSWGSARSTLASSGLKENGNFICQQITGYNLPPCQSSPPLAPSYRGSHECHGRGEYQQCPLRNDLAIGGLQTPEIRLLGGLPWRTQWVSSASVMTLPESLSSNITMLEGKSTLLQVDLSQSDTKEQGPKALFLGGGLSPTPATSPTRAFPPK